jgi:hypothetical protein
MKIGDKVTAKRQMFSPSGSILTVGNEYTVCGIQEDYFLIVNDRGNDHSFDKSTFEKHFEKSDEFKKACKPLMKYLSENHHPHVKVIVDCNTAEMVEGMKFFESNEFILD